VLLVFRATACLVLGGAWLLTRLQSSAGLLARTGALARLARRCRFVAANDTFIRFTLDAAPAAKP